LIALLESAMRRSIPALVSAARARRDMRTQPIGIRAVSNLFEFKPNERITVARNPDIGRRARPDLERDRYTIITKPLDGGFSPLLPASSYDLPVEVSIPLPRTSRARRPGDL